MDNSVRMETSDVPPTNGNMPSSREAIKQNEAIIGQSDIRPRDNQLWRDLGAYWILGLCNNYGYVVMLSAAHDIIKQFNTGHDPETVDVYSARECNIISTGAILLADIIPALIVKVLAPFIPFWVHVRVAIAILAAASGFLLVGYATAEWMALLGVVVTSFSSGLGETTFLSYSSKFNKNVISTWSSGTGGAGVIGSISYAGLTSFGISPVTTMLIMLLFPAIEGVAFWILLRRPKLISSNSAVDGANTNDVEEVAETEIPIEGFLNKLSYILRSLTKYMVPLTLVYLFEYFINQGMFELVYFKDIWLNKDAQYRWLQVDYQLGVFVSRSSVNLFTIKKIWLMSLLQFINVIYFLAEVVLFMTPNIWIVFLIVFWEGLLGGAAYVNTFYRMSKEIPNDRKQFSLGIVTLSDTFGIAAAGFLAIPAHNFICGLPLLTRQFTF